jgi:putative hemolysin
MIILIISVFIALAVSLSCSVLEAVLLSLSNSDLAYMTQNRPVSANIWKKFRSNIQKPLAVILIVNTFAHTAGATISGAQFNELFGDRWFWLFSLLFSLVMIQWTEILPKSIAVRHNRGIAGIVAIPFNLAVMLFKPIVAAIEWLNRPFESKKKDNRDSSVSDISVLARSAFLENLISKEQESLIAHSVYMSGLKAQDVMIDRNDINLLSTAMSLQEGLIAAHLHRHTRFPLTEDGNLDQIVGYVNFKDIVGALQINPSDPSLRGIMRPVLFVKGDTRLPELLAKLTRGYQHIAVVQNDTGATIGLVTLEDIIESLVGKLQDEYDTPPDFIVQLSERKFRVGGSATFQQLKTRAFNDLTRTDDLTIDRWLKETLKGNVPPENYTVKLDSFTIKVRRVVRGNIYDVTIEQQSAPVVAGLSNTVSS